MKKILRELLAGIKKVCKIIKSFSDDLLELAAQFHVTHLILQKKVHELTKENVNLKATLRFDRETVEVKEILTTQVIETFQADATAIASDVNSYQAQIRSTRGKDAADKRHEPINKKLEEIRKVWASGVYKTKDKCAEVEGKKHNISYSAVRKALYNR